MTLAMSVFRIEQPFDQQVFV